MLIKKINDDGAATGAATFFTNSTRLDNYPFNEDITIQYECSASATGSLTLQGRAHPDMDWVDIGAAVTIPAGLKGVFQRKNAPEIRLKWIKTSAGKQTLTSWVGR